jgi:hypothetical protein
MIINEVIENIVRSNSIVDYLSNRGIHPARQMGNKYVYNSPLPQAKGSDSTPSFFVYDKGDHQDFYCYSSKVGGNIITLHSCLSNKKFIDSLRDFHDFENVDDIALQIAIDKTSESMSSSQDEPEFDFEFLKLSLSIRKCIKNLIEKKSDYKSDLNGIWEKVEDIIESENPDTLGDLHSEILSYYGTE